MARRILVVEDDATQRDVLAAFLEAQSFYVETATDGLDGLHKARIGRFDVILLDYRIPEIDGAALARLIGDLTSENRRPLLVGLSAGLPGLVEGGLINDVFDSILQKPWNFDALLAVVGRGNEAGNPSLRDVAWNAAAGDQAASPNEIPRVLVVDDDQVSCSLIAAAVQSCGFAVDTASNGFAALHMIRARHFDVAIIDFNLPDLDGVAVAKLTFDLVRSQRRPRLIALTATPHRVGEREAKPVSDFDEVLDKSAGIGAVLQAVQRCAAYKRLRPGPFAVAVDEMVKGAELQA